MAPRKKPEPTEPNPGIPTGPLKPENRGIPLPEEKTDEAPAPIETDEDTPDDESTDESSDESTDETEDESSDDPPASE